jgi:cell filamentation protein
MDDVVKKKISYIKTTFNIDNLSLDDNFLCNIICNKRKERVSVEKRVYSNWEDYFIGSTDVLRNIPNISDKNSLSEYERQMSAERLSELFDASGNYEFSKEYLYSIHGYLFQDVYDWAGDIRSVAISKQQTNFLDPSEINNYLDNVFESASREITTIHDRFQFANFLSYLFCRLNFAHPFRDGNGRTIREFLRQLVDSISFDFGSFEIDYSKMNPESLAFGLSCNVPMFITTEFEKSLSEKEKSKCLKKVSY